MNIFRKYITISFIIVFPLYLISCSNKKTELRDNDIVIENAQMRLIIRSDGTAKSLVHKPTGQECLKKEANLPAFSIIQDMPYDVEFFLTYPAKPKRFNADTVYRIGQDLIVGFELEHHQATIGLNITDDYIGFTLKKLDYNIDEIGKKRKRKTEIDEFTILQLPIRDRKYFGEWLNVSWDKDVAVNLLGTDQYAKIEAEARNGWHLFKAQSVPEVRLINVGAALVVTDKDNLLNCIDQLEEDYNLPRGVQSRRSDEYKYSYYSFRKVTTQNIDEHIAFAKKGGFRTVMVYWPSFATSMGHFPWRPEYPNGMEDLKTITKKVKEAGMIPGFHFHYNKASKTDTYVSPIPDPRLNLKKTFTLASSLDEHSTTIEVEENPNECTLEEGRRFLKLGEELVTYEHYTTSPPYKFIGCIRGALDSPVSSFGKGFKFGLLDVDSWPVFIRFDQNTSIQLEMAKRIGNIYAEAGFQFVYFDGAEDVHPPYWYNVSKAQMDVYSCLEPEPLFSEGATKSHFGWHILTRGNAFDPFKPELVKEATNKYPVVAAKNISQDFSSINFGWVNYVSPGKETIGMQPDMFEYVCSRAAAWDCPISLAGYLDQLKLHPRTDDNLEVIRRWEEIRIQNFLTGKQKEELRSVKKQEHILIINENGDFELLPYTQISGIPIDPSAIRAFAFTRKGKSYIVYWHSSGNAKIKLNVDPQKIKLYKKLNNNIPIEGQNNTIILPVDDRRYLVFDLPMKDAVKIFNNKVAK